MPPLTRKDLELAIAGGTATVQDFEGHDPELVREIKQAAPYQQRALHQVAARAVDAEAKTAELIFNIQAPDRMGDLILSNPADAAKYGGKGWQLEPWEAAGAPYLYHHTPLWVIGKVLSTQVKRIPVPDWVGASGKRAWALIGTVKHFDDGRLPWAEAAWLLTVEGITGSSVGFIPKMVVWPEDEEERTKLGLGRWGVLIPWQEMLEISKAVVPANAGSVGLAAGEKPGAQERAVDDALKRFVDEGKLAESIAADYRRFVPLGPTDEAQRVAARVREVVPMVGVDLAERAQELECVGGHCKTFTADDLQLTLNDPELRETVRQALAGAEDAPGPETVLPKELRTGFLSVGCGCGGTESRQLLDALAEDLGVDNHAQIRLALTKLRTRAAETDDEPLVDGLTRAGRARIETAFERSSELTEALREILDAADDEDLNGDDDQRSIEPARDEPPERKAAPASAADTQSPDGDDERSDTSEPVARGSEASNRSSGAGGAGGDVESGGTEVHPVLADRKAVGTFLQSFE